VKSSRSFKSLTKAAIPKPREGDPMILIVDDTVFNLMILKNILEMNHKLQIEQAVSGEEAILKCQQRVQDGKDAFRLIIMDINMPGMDGVVATQNIRKFLDPYVKERGQLHYQIVAHTALPEEQFGDCKEKGFDGFMQKPIISNVLRAILKKVNLI
jgi:CheY-like chemotaxis protein